jgi:Mrp family chromosome partitioning ATPase
MRKKPMDALVKGLIERDGTSQRIMVISGVGGSGKTQLALKFARDFQERWEKLHVSDSTSSHGLSATIMFSSWMPILPTAYRRD